MKIKTKTRQAKPKDVLLAMVQKGMLAEARELYLQVAESQARRAPMAAVFSDILIKCGYHGAAEQLLSEELQSDPDNYDLLMLLGRLDERNGQNLNAFDLYHLAGFMAAESEQKKKADRAKDRVKRNIKGKTAYGTETYTVMLKGNDRPLEIEYDIGKMAVRKRILDAILENIDPRAKSVLEIEYDAGIITKNLNDHGFNIEGVSARLENVSLAMGFEYVESIRMAGIPSPKYYGQDINRQSVSNLKKRDVIMVLPMDENWYTEHGVEEAAELLAELMEKAKKQLFFFIPANPEEKRKPELAEKIIGCLVEKQIIDQKLQPCYESKAGSKLFCINRRQAREGDREKVVPPGLEVVGSRSAIFEVELSKCRSLNGFGYTEQGWDHFTELLKEILEKKNLSYKDSILKRFYDAFQPANRQEHLLGSKGELLPPLNKGWTVLPWMETKNRILNPQKSPESRPGGNHHYGPNSDEFGSREFKKLISTFALIRKYGYIPEIFPDGYILGYLLKDDSDYRFLLTEGQHRVATVGLMGYKKIKVKFDPNFLPVVDIKKIKQWPQVKSGLFNVDVAEKVFRYYFEEDGRRKAKELGLL